MRWSLDYVWLLLKRPARFNAVFFVLIPSEVR